MDLEGTIILNQKKSNSEKQRIECWLSRAKDGGNGTTLSKGTNSQL